MDNYRFNLPAVFESSSPEETEAIGGKIGRILKAPCVLALRGPLGAGKTCFVRGLALSLGIKETIVSPTYTIVLEYEAPKFPFFHIDAYRLSGDDDFASMGGDEYLESGGIAVVEWSERIPLSLPKDAVFAEIAVLEDGKRFITVSGGYS